MAGQKNGISCPLCGGTESTVLSHKDRHGKPLETRCCQSCGMVFNNPIPSEDELRAFYSDDYRKDYKNTVEPKLKHHIRYAKGVLGQIKINPDIYRHAHTVLDIGSGSGEALALLKAAGADVEGIEPTRDYATYVARTFDVPVFNGSIDDFKTDRSFDHIRMNHVVEHLRDPIEKLTLIRSLLTDEGTLHVEVPDVRAYLQVKSAGKAFHYGHIFNYAEETLKMMAAKAGFKEVARCGPTSIYFEKTAPFEFPPNASVAEDIETLNTKHLNGEFRGTKRGVRRVVTKAMKALGEQKEVSSFKSPQAVIDHFGKEIRAVLA